jgi:hypothetical protein
VDNGGTLEMNSPFFKERLKLDKVGTRFVKSFSLPPGEHIINFKSDGQRVAAPNDNRELVFRVRNFKLTPAPATPEPAAQPAPTPAEKTKAAGAGR